MKPLTLSMIGTLALCSGLFARDIYTVGFTAQGKQIGCHQARWAGGTEFFNTGANQVTIRLIGVSNGAPLVALPASFDLGAQQVGHLPPDWQPSGTNPAYALWVVHLDVPDGVVIRSRDVVQDSDICTAPPLPGAIIKTPLPVFTSLATPNDPQVKLGTDIGSLVARENVMIYNAGTATANVTITVRRTCDNALVDSRTTTVPANSILQEGGLSTGSSEVSCDGDRFNRHTIITSDQPGFSIVSTLTEDRSDSAVVPLVGIVVQ